MASPNDDGDGDDDDDDFAAKTESFLTWLQDWPGASVCSKISITDLRKDGCGRGIVALQNIEEDEELFSFPQSTILSSENSKLRQLMPDILHRLDAWHSLILVMMYEDGQGQASAWWPYLDILPRRFDTLIYWSPAQLAELQGCAVIDKIGKDDADASFLYSLLPVVQEHSEIFGLHAETFRGPEAELCLLALAHRMATLIMAYGFDLEPDVQSSEEDDEMGDDDDDGGSSQTGGDLRKGMIPLADLFNAAGDLNNAHLVQHDGRVAMVALKPIRTGQQIYNDYGQLPTSDLLRRYGYVSDEYKKWDVVEISIESMVAAALERNTLSDKSKEDRLQLSMAWNTLEDSYDLQRPPIDEAFAFDQDLLLTVTALLLDDEAYKEAVVSLDPPPQTLPSVMLNLCLTLKDVISQRLESYRTTVAEDTRLLQSDNLKTRHRMAVLVRSGEKEILALASREIDRKLSELGGAVSDDHQESQRKKMRRT